MYRRRRKERIESRKRGTRTSRGEGRRRRRCGRKEEIGRRGENRKILSKTFIVRCNSRILWL